MQVFFCNMLGTMELVNLGPVCVKMVTKEEEVSSEEREENLGGWVGPRWLRLSSPNL